MKKHILINKLWIYSYPFRMIWYYIEVYFSIILSKLGFKKDKTVIPEGHYCYTWDDEREKNQPHINGGFWVKTCKYYRNLKRYKAACTYVGYIGWDACLGDQCKICGENYGDDRDPIIIEREDKITKIINRKK